MTETPREFDLSATFGMTEMETAGSRVLVKCIDARSWVTPISWDVMTSESEQRGFLHLIRVGYLKWIYRKDFFYVTQDFIDRVSERSASVRDAIEAAGLLPVEPSDDRIWRFEFPGGPERADDAPDLMARPITEEDLATMKRRVPLVDDGNIRGFFGDYRCLSNFHLAPVMFDSQVYPSTEHAFQAAKYPRDRRQECLRFSCTEVKRWGREARISREEWDARKVGVMHEVVLAKFMGHVDLRERLLATEWRRLVELNDWGDDFWGVLAVRDGDAGPYKESGKNMLGRVLMAVRRTLQLDHGQMISERP